MSDLSIANSVFDKLIADSTFLDYLGLTPASLMGDKVKKIQKEMEPTGLSADNMPLVCIYPIPGVRSRMNQVVYDAMFEVVIYSSSSSGVKTATQKPGTMTIGELLSGDLAKGKKGLLHQVQLAGATFLTEYQGSYQAPSGVSGIKKYIQRYKVSEEIG